MSRRSNQSNERELRCHVVCCYAQREVSKIESYALPSFLILQRLQTIRRKGGRNAGGMLSPPPNAPRHKKCSPSYRIFIYYCSSRTAAGGLKFLPKLRKKENWQRAKTTPPPKKISQIPPLTADPLPMYSSDCSGLGDEEKLIRTV